VNPHPTALALEAALHGVEGADVAGVKAHLAQCERCRSRADEVRTERAHFERLVLPRTIEAMGEAVGRRARWAPLRLLRWTPLLLAPVAAMLLFLVTPLSALRGPDVLRKGAPSVAVYALRGDRVFQVADGEQLRPGDRLRFEVDPGGLPYLLLVSIDAAGRPNVYAPYGGVESLAVDPHSRFVSPGSIELDAATGPERLFVLLSRAPLPTAEVVAELSRLKDPESVRQNVRLAVHAEAQLSFLWQNEGR
jgi:hypothetical protein